MLTNILDSRLHKARRAADHFGRFLELNRERLARVAGQPIAERRVEDLAAMNTACREWLPHLRDPQDRKTCQAIINLLDKVASYSPLCSYCGKFLTLYGDRSDPDALCAVSRLRMRNSAQRG